MLLVFAMAGCGPEQAPSTADGTTPSPAPAAQLTTQGEPPAVNPIALTPTPVPTRTGPPPAYCSGKDASQRPPATANTGPHGSFTNTGTRGVALTFDDGPDPVNTPKLLDVLAACGVKATFCMEGQKVVLYPDVVRRVYAEGHTVCNHSWRHIRQLGTYGQPRIRRDLTDTNNAIHAIVPDAKISYFRAPGGAWTDDYLKVCADLGMTPIHWDVDPSDWQSEVYGYGPAMVNHIVHEVRTQTRPGSIILSHDYQKPNTTEAYRILLPWLISQFELIALPPGGLSTGGWRAAAPEPS